MSLVYAYRSNHCRSTPRPGPALERGRISFVWGCRMCARKGGRVRQLGGGICPVRQFAHLDAECIAMCLPVCVAGGVLAAAVVSWYGALRERGAWFWASASGLALLTGAVGATCAGYQGVVAVAVGYAAGFAGAFLVVRLRRVGRTNDKPD